MSLLHGLSTQQKLAGFGLSVLALFGLGAAGSSYLDRPKRPSLAATPLAAVTQTQPETGRAWTPSPAPKPGKKQRPALGSVNINTASPQDLERLPGIGPATAQRIVEYRTTHGGFQSLEELDNVKGIGPKKLSDILPYCRL